MLDGDYVMRDICLAGTNFMHRSAMGMVLRRKAVLRTSPSVSRGHLTALDGYEVVAAVRDGRVLIGRLRVTDNHVIVGRLDHGIPCRYHFKFGDIVGCHSSGREDDDEPTQPMYHLPLPPVTLTS